MPLSSDFTRFMNELEKNNVREWFHDNKKRYQTDVKEPFEQLVQEVIDRMKKIDPEITVTPKECVFRIYRDVRFSKDKSPYKTHMAAYVSRGGRKDYQSPGLYFQANGHGVSIAGGSYKPEKNRLYRIREKIAADPKAFHKVINGKKFVDTCGGLAETEQNKIIPKEFREAGEIAPEIYNKSFHFWREYDGQKYVKNPELSAFLVDHFKAAKSLNEYLRDTA